MKTVETKFLKTYNAFILLLLALFGYACSKDPFSTKTEYGTPSAKFIVQGKVVSLSNDQAINNIQVVMKGDTVMTDQNGNYKVADKFGFPTDQTYTVRFKDVDGTLNGAFDNLDTVVEFKNPKFINGDGHWYNGETEKDVTVKLTPKK